MLKKKITKWDIAISQTSSTKDIIKEDGNYVPKFLTDEEINNFRFPKRSRKEAGK